MLNDLKNYFDSSNTDLIKKYIKINFNNGDYHRVILYGKKMLNDYYDIETLIYVTYSFIKLDYFKMADKMLNKKEIEICEKFLTSNLKIDILFKILFYLKVDIKIINQFISNFDLNYPDNHYYNIYYLSSTLKDNYALMSNGIEKELLHLEDDIHFHKNVKLFLNEFVQKSTPVKMNFDYFHNSYTNKEISIKCYDTSDGMATCNIFTYKKNTILIDCGAMITNGKIQEISLSEFLKENYLSLNDISAVLITHAHLDHYGSLNSFLNSNIPIYMTKETFELISMVSKNIEVSKLNINIITEYNEFYINNLQITPIKNGHILGSVAYHIENENLSILFTGDFSIDDQNTIKGLNLNEITRCIDILVIESTYGIKRLNFSRKDSEIMLANLISDTINIGKSVFIPAFAIGRTQEILSIKRKYNLNEIMVIDGLSKKITLYYEEKLKTKFYDLDIIPNDYEIDDLFFKNPKIVVASSGMLAKDSTFIKKYFKFIKDINGVFVKIGYMDPDNLLYENLISEFENNVFDFNLSAHVDYNGLLHTVSYLDPKIVISHHGKGIEF